MPAVWIESLDNLHCPTCDERLIQYAGRFQPLEKAEPTYVADGGKPPVCPQGHRQPDWDALYAYRDERGHPEQVPVREVPSPQ